MRIALSPQQYFSLEGKPLVSGRLQIHLHDSDTLATVYTLDGGVYTIADNPVYLDDAGEVHDTRWVDDGVYDVDVEARQPDGTYQKISEFQFGFVMPSVNQDTLVDGLAGLKDADPALGIVSVYGYDAYCTAPKRDYIWDPNCTLQPDDGVIVESNSSEDGRWCLLWDDEKLPCTVYGIVPGHEQNLNAFLTYPETISQWNIATPPIIRFLKGVYTANAIYSTSKPIYCDAGAQFSNATFWTPSLTVAESNSYSYVGDFRFTDPRAVAHSSWFRSVAAFWGCQARHLICDPANWFANNVINQSVTVTDAVIEGVGVVNMVFQSSARLTLTNCAINARAIFNPSSAVITLLGMRWSDLWWTTTDPSYFNFGTGANIEFDPSYNSWNIDDFGIADTYARLLSAYGVTKIELCGRSVNALHNLGFTVVSNGEVGALTSNNSIALADVNVDNLRVTHGDLQLTRCSVNVYALADSITAVDSFINVIPNVDPNTTLVSVTGGSWYGRINPVDYDDLSKGKSVVFRRCNIDAPQGTVSEGARLIRANLLDIEDSMLHCPLVTFPLLISANEQNNYYLNFNFAGNQLDGDAYIQIAHSGSPEYLAHPEVHDVELTRLRIVNNQFLQNDNDGIKMPFYSTDRWYRFIKGLGTTYTYQYWGNTGKCPLACPPTASDNPSTGPYFEVGLTKYYIGYRPLNYRVFAVPAYVSDGGSYVSDHHTVGLSGMVCMTANTVSEASRLAYTEGEWASNHMTDMRMPGRSCLIPSVCFAPDTLPDDAFTVYYGLKHFDDVNGYYIHSWITPCDNNKVDLTTGNQ